MISVLIFIDHLLSNNRQRWQAPNVPAELAKTVTREICFSEILWGSKDKTFLGLFSLGIIIQMRQLACEPQTGSLAIFQLLSGMERKKTTSSLDRSSTSSNIQVADFVVPQCEDKQC